MILNIAASTRRFLSTLSWSIRLSWQASRLYTFIRLLIEAATPMLSIAIAFTTKSVMDILADTQLVDDSWESLLQILIILPLIGMARRAAQQILLYCQSMHNETIKKLIALLIMERGFAADLAFFDDPAYHDKLASVSRDSYSINYVVQHTMNSKLSGVRQKGKLSTNTKRAGFG